MSKNHSDDQALKVQHFRRCHVCGEVCVSYGSAIHRCEHCGKHLAPFYYFDESSLEGISENGLHFSLIKSSDGYNPIWGLSTYWQEPENESDSRGHS